MSRANQPDRDAETGERGSIKTSAEPAVSPAKEAPRLAPAQSALLDLQRSHGNQFVVELLQQNGGGQPLDEHARAGMEQRLGQDFGQVRVHNDAQSARAAEALDAQAFTAGRDVYFASGRYHPDPADPLLAHELVHVAQQSGGAPTTTGHAGLEAQADLAEHVVTGRAAGLEISAGSQGVQRKADDSSETATTAPQQQQHQQQQKQKSPSFFERLGHGIGEAAGAVWKGVKTAGAAIGHGIATAAEAVWNGLQWVGRHLWDKATGVFERVMNWVSRLPERLARLVRGLWEGVRSLHPWALKWWESLAKADTWVDFLKWLGTAALNILEVMGIGEVYETAMEFIKFNTRKMTGTEMDEAASVFGSSINLELVRIDEYAVLGPYWTKREYTSFHTINGWGGIDDATMIHELTHVWQYQQAGAIYMPQAIHAQGAGGYEYGGAEGLKDARKAGLGLLSFNREQQAQIVEDFYLLKTHRPPMFRDAERTDLPVYAHFVKEVSTHTKAELIA